MVSKALLICVVLVQCIYGLSAIPLLGSPLAAAEFPFANGLAFDGLPGPFGLVGLNTPFDGIPGPFGLAGLNTPFAYDRFPGPCGLAGFNTPFDGIPGPFGVGPFNGAFGLRF